jgi:hypothetical protein
VPAPTAADWLTSAWDQNAGLYVARPAAAVVEEDCRGWLAQLLGLPADVSVAYVTGCPEGFQNLGSCCQRVVFVNESAEDVAAFDAGQVCWFDLVDPFRWGEVECAVGSGRSRL